MQADDQSSQSPSHSLSFDHDTPQRQSATSSNHYNTYNIQTLPNMQNRNKMYATEFCSSTKPSCKIQPRSNKKQTLNVDDKSLTSLPCSYQYNTLMNNELPSTSNGNFSNKYPHSVLELVGDGKDSKMDNSVILNNAKKSINYDNNVNSVEMPSSEGARKRYKRNSFLRTADDNYDKNYSKLEKKLNVSNTTEKYLRDIDILNAECQQVSTKEDKISRAERKCNKNNIIDVSALKCKTTYFDNTDNVISYISDKEFEKAKLAYLSNLDKLAKEHSITSGSDTLKKTVRNDKKNVKSSKSNVTESLVARNINDYELLDSSQYPDHKYDVPKPSNVPSEYVDMGKSFKEKKYFAKDVHPEKDLNDANRVTNRKSNKIMRRHTTEYRGPSHFTVPHMVHDSSDSVEKSPAVKKNSVKNYPYLMLTESKFSQKKSSLTSTTSEDNSDAMISTLKTRIQTKEWRDNKIPRKIDSQTVDRKLYRKNSSKSAKIKRRGSLNIIDPTANKTQFNKENHNTKSPLLDPKKVSLQISAEDMVQIANCGARNKNGSLCHFISTNNDNYLSISQALLNQSSSSEDVLTNKTLPSKHSIDKKSSHSLVLNLSDDCLNIEESKNNVSLKSIEMDNVHNSKSDSLAKRHKGHSRQHSHDVDRMHRKEEYIANKKLVHTKSEGQRSYKVPNYYPENGASLKQHAGQDKRILDSAECRCLVSNHTLAMMDGKKHDMNNEVNYGGVTYRHFGASSREELTNSQDIEDTFDF